MVRLVCFYCLHLVSPSAKAALGAEGYEMTMLWAHTEAQACFVVVQECADERLKSKTHCFFQSRSVRSLPCTHHAIRRSVMSWLCMLLAAFCPSAEPVSLDLKVFLRTRSYVSFSSSLSRDSFPSCRRGVSKSRIMSWGWDLISDFSNPQYDFNQPCSFKPGSNLFHHDLDLTWFKLSFKISSLGHDG